MLELQDTRTQETYVRKKRTCHTDPVIDVAIGGATFVKPTPIIQTSPNSSTLERFHIINWSLKESLFIIEAIFKNFRTDIFRRNLLLEISNKRESVFMAKRIT
jgi:hypothetical protein